MHEVSQVTQQAFHRHVLVDRQRDDRALVLSDFQQQRDWDGLDNHMHDFLLLAYGLQVVVELENFGSEAYFVKGPLVHEHQLVELTDFLFLLKGWQLKVGLEVDGPRSIRITVIVVNMSELVAIWLILVLQDYLTLDLLVLSIESKDIGNDVLDQVLLVKIKWSQRQGLLAANPELDGHQKVLLVRVVLVWRLQEQIIFVVVVVFFIQEGCQATPAYCIYTASIEIVDKARRVHVRLNRY